MYTISFCVNPAMTTCYKIHTQFMFGFLSIVGSDMIEVEIESTLGIVNSFEREAFVTKNNDRGFRYF